MRKLLPRKASAMTFFFIALTVAVVAAIPGALVFFSLPTLFNIAHLSYVFLIIALICVATPIGGITLGKEHFTPKKNWFASVASAQVAFGIIVLSSLHTAVTYLPYQSLLGDNLAINTIFHDLLYSYGFHPWPMLSVLSVSLAYVFYKKKKAPIFASLWPFIINSKIDIFVKRILQVLLNISLFFSIATSIGLGALQLTKLLTNTPSSHTELATPIFAALVLGLMSMKGWNNIINKLIQLRVSLGLFLLGCLLFLTVAIVARDLMAPLIHSLIDQQNSFTLPARDITISVLAWKIIIWVWWIGWTPIVASYIARISAGKSIRFVMLGSLILPMLFTAFCLHTPFNLATANYGSNTLALLGPLLVIVFSIKAHSSKLIVFGFMPEETRHVYASARRMNKFLQPFLNTIAMLMFAYLWIGLRTLGFFMLLASFFCFLLLVVSGSFFLLGLRNRAVTVRKRS